MCGIVGVAGSIYKSEKDAFENLLVFSQIRGPHSTGIASVDRHKNDLIIAKAVGRPDMLIDYDKRYDRAIGFNKKFMLGHNRWATQGNVTKRNAHPFAFDHIVGCHNGTVSEQAVKKLKKYVGDFGTDSETILANMNEFPLKEVFNELWGAWALVWFDSRDNTLNFLRNKERDLFYTYNSDRKAIFWASEVGFLKAALDRNKIENKGIYLLPENKHFSWNIPDVSQQFTGPKQEDVDHGNFPSQTWRQGYEKGHWDGYGQGYGGSLFAEKDDEEKDLNKPGSNIIDASKLLAAPKKVIENFAHPSKLDFAGQGYLKGKKNKDIYRGFNGAALNKDEFEKCTKDNCAWCDAQAEWGKPVRFVSVNKFVCLDCNSDSVVAEIFPVRK